MWDLLCSQKYSVLLKRALNYHGFPPIPINSGLLNEFKEIFSNFGVIMMDSSNTVVNYIQSRTHYLMCLNRWLATSSARAISSHGWVSQACATENLQNRQIGSRVLCPESIIGLLWMD